MDLKTVCHDNPQVLVGCNRAPVGLFPIKYREDGERYMSTFHYDMRSKEVEHARKVSQLASQVSGVRHSANEQVSKQGIVGDCNISHVILQLYDTQVRKRSQKSKRYNYTEEYLQQKGKGSFPAHVTPGYQAARKAGEMASDVSMDTHRQLPKSTWRELICLTMLLNGLFQVKYHEKYERELKGKGSSEAGTMEFALARENAENFSQVGCDVWITTLKGDEPHCTHGYSNDWMGRLIHTYTEEYEQHKGKGSFPAMITPAYQLAKKAHDLASDLKYKQDLSKMKGQAHYHTMTTEDNLALKTVRKINKLVSEVEYKKDLENTKGHSINYCETPQFKNTSKMSKFTSDIRYKEKYANHIKGHYEGSGLDRKTAHAMKARKLASNIAYKSDYEQEKAEQTEYNYPATNTPSYHTQKKLEPLKDVNYRQHIDKLRYSSVTDTPDIVQARINSQQLSDLNYRASYEKTKTQYTLPEDLPQIRTAKANAELYSNIKYKESFMKSKDKAVGVNVSDSKTLHSLHVAKMNSEVAYKKGFKENQGQYHLSLDMMQLSQAKKAQALASDLDYRKRLHEYTVLPDDMKVQQAKKAYELQSENQYRSDLNWMKGVGWEADGCLDVKQAKKAGDLLSDKKYRQRVDQVKFTQVSLLADSGLTAGTEQVLHQYTMSKDEPLFLQAKANADLLSAKVYRSSWEQQRDKGFELRMDALSILTAKAKRDLASDVKYKEQYEKTKGKMVGVKGVSEDSQLAHATWASRLQSDRDYRQRYKDSKTLYSVSLDMMALSHARKAQDLATDTSYRSVLHQYTSLPTDMAMTWARKAYNLQSDKLYRSDLNWMKGVGWATAGSLDVEQARKATDMASEKKYRQQVSALKFTSVEDTPEMVQAKISNKQAVDRLYREKGENMKHHYTLTNELPEHIQAKLNAMNLSETRYKESWTKLRDTGYKLRLDAIPFQAAKASTDILNDHKYKEEFEKSKGHIIGLKGVQDDINMSHVVRSGELQSDVSGSETSAKMLSQFHQSMDMLEVIHAKKAQSLISDKEYRLTLHNYTALPDDLKLQAAKRASILQSEKHYRSDLNFLRGAAWIGTGAVQIEGSKRASDLISERKYRQHPFHFKHTSVADSPDIVHAKFSNKISNERLYREAAESFRHSYTLTAERPEITQAKINAANFSEIKYRESWKSLRAQGYKLTMQDIPFQAAKASTGIASDYQYKHNFLLEKGKHIGARSILDDPQLLHCLQVAKLQSEQEYRRHSRSASAGYHLSLDMMQLSQAKKAQALASDLDYRKRLHEYTVLPDDMKVQQAKRAYELQSEKLYRSDLNFMKGVAWEALGTPQLESAKKAGELATPVFLWFQRLYRAGDSDALHRYTLPVDHPDFIRARMNAQHVSEKAYRTSGEQVRSGGYDLRLDAIPFQTAKASREIASDFRYKEAFVKEKGHQVGALCVEDDPRIKHSLAVSKLQSSHQYKKQSQESRSQYRLHADQPEFLQARRSQAQASNRGYRQHLHSYTCDPEQLALKHAKRAYGLQSDLNYKSDLNWIRGVGWTPPGSHKVEMARRAAELGLAEGLDPEQAIAQYQQMMVRGRPAMVENTGELQQPAINPDAMEVLHVKRMKTIHMVKKTAK
uniref:Nebulin-related anchoring protein n=1 Tax=Paramormyrops kingsleyae TaxID=1676925 RepID=A0A3B3SDX1_9TELE